MEYLQDLRKDVFLSSCLLVFGSALLVFGFFPPVFLIALHLSQLFNFSKSSRICWCFFFVFLFFFFLVPLCSAFVLDHVGGIYLAQISDEKKKKMSTHKLRMYHASYPREPGWSRLRFKSGGWSVFQSSDLLSRFCPSHVFVFVSFSYQCK